MYDIGIDVGGTGIAAGLVDNECKFMARKDMVTDRNVTAQELSETLRELAKELLEENGIVSDKVQSIGVGVPGTANHRTGWIEDANNLPRCCGNIRKFLQEKTLKPVYLENDANAAAWGECLCLKERPESIVMVTLGTGVGGGIILNGKIWRGINYAAGELGHMTIRYDGIACNCGRRGCLEVYASGEALIAQADQAMIRDAKSVLWDMRRENQGHVNGKMVFDAYRQGDGTAMKVVKEYAGYLSEGLANIINILRPEVLCIGGGISRSGDILLPMLQELVRNRSYGVNSAEKTKLTSAKLGNDAGIIGAAKLRLTEQEEVRKLRQRITRT